MRLLRDAVDVLLESVPRGIDLAGTFAALGTAIENGFRLHVTENGGKLAGREVEIVRVDDE